MSGIGVIIILIQTLPFFGLPTAAGGPIGAIRAWPAILAGLNLDALIIAGLSLAIMIFWPHACAPLCRRRLPPVDRHAARPVAVAGRAGDRRGADRPADPAPAVVPLATLPRSFSRR